MGCLIKEGGKEVVAKGSMVVGSGGKTERDADQEEGSQ